MKRLGFLASGRGSNMLAIIRACESGRLPASPVLVISNNPDARALQLGSEHGLEALHMSRRTHGDAAALDQAMTAAMQSHQVDLVILAGYMKKIGPQLLSAYAHRILNIHPSLLPRHGGRGMYGLHVHEAVIAAGETETGVTVHLVNAEYDSGDILAQRTVSVAADDDAESLAARVLEVEHRLYTEVLGKILSGEITLPE